jgi:hypothetical protein
MSPLKNPIAWLALFVALGGTAYAASELPAGSVGTRQLRAGAVTDAKVHAHTLSAGALSPGLLSALETAKPLQVTIANSPIVGPPACGADDCPVYPAGTTSALIDVPCPSGQHAISGGYTAMGADEAASVDQPLANDTGWRVSFVLTTSSEYPIGIVYAVCATTQTTFTTPGISVP